LNKYSAPVLPDDMLPELDARIAEVEARLNAAKAEGFALYMKARAQQTAAEMCLARGNTTDHAALMAGIQGVPGVRQLDELARIRWDEARAYKTELDNLKAQKGADSNGRS